mgnify:CR=1 FL=1
MLKEVRLCYLINFVFIFWLVTVHRRMILMLVSYIILVFTAQSFRSHAVDPGTGLTLPVARPISQRSINNDKKGDCCCCNSGDVELTTPLVVSSTPSLAESSVLCIVIID